MLCGVICVVEFPSTEERDRAEINGKGSEGGFWTGRRCDLFSPGGWGKLCGVVVFVLLLCLILKEKRTGKEVVVVREK